MRRWISLAVVMVMLTPVVASAAEGTMATWLSPQPGQIVSGARVEVAVGYNTQSTLKVTSLELYVDGKFYTRKILGTPESRGVCSFWWDVTREQQGTHDLVVKVFAGDQLISKVYGTGTVGRNGQSRGIIDTRPPVVTFANISSQDILTGTTTVKIHAADDSGEPPMVSLLVDDVLKLIKNTPPYTYDLDTTTYPDGDHALKTYAYDGAGNKSDPAVVNVTFRNGAKNPVVTTLSVGQQEGELLEEFDGDDLPALINPVTDSNFATASRSAFKNDADTYTAPPVATPKPQPQVVAAAPKTQAQVIAAAPKTIPAPKHTSSTPKSVSASVQPNLRPADSALKTNNSIAASAPQIKPDPVVAAPKLTQGGVKMASASIVPSLRSEHAASAEVAAPVSIKPAEPKTQIAEAKHTETVQVAKAEESMPLRQTGQKLTQQPASSEAPVVLVTPVPSPAGKMVPQSQLGDLKNVETAPATLSAPESAAPKIVEGSAALSQESLKRVQIAMAPNLHAARAAAHTSPAIACPPATPKQAPARIEKNKAVVSGKVKARSFFESMGGVLFWDAANRTVTAFVGDVIFEMKIGSRIARVNGKEVMMDSAPYLVSDRTIFDAGNYAQACAQAQNSLALAR